MSDYPVTRGGRPGDTHLRLRLAALTAVITGVILVALAAFLFSYTGIHHIALQAGVAPKLARLYPLMFDAMLIITCSAVLATRAAGWGTKTYVWVCLLVVVGAVAVGDALYATGVHLTGQAARATIAVIPWVLLLLGFGIWLVMLRHWRRIRVPGTVTEAETAQPQADQNGHAGRAVPAAPAGQPDRAPQPAQAGRTAEASRTAEAMAASAAAGGAVSWAAGRGAAARSRTPQAGIDSLLEQQAGRAPERPPAADGPAASRTTATGQDKQRTAAPGERQPTGTTAAAMAGTAAAAAAGTAAGVAAATRSDTKPGTTGDTKPGTTGDTMPETTAPATPGPATTAGTTAAAAGTAAGVAAATRSDSKPGTAGETRPEAATPATPGPATTAKPGAATATTAAGTAPATRPETAGAMPGATAGTTPGTLGTTTGTAAATPGTAPATSGTAPATPGTAPATSGTTAATPGATADTPGATADTPGTSESGADADAGAAAGATGAADVAGTGRDGGGKDEAPAQNRRRRLGGLLEMPADTDDETGSVRILPAQPKAPSADVAPGKDHEAGTPAGAAAAATEPDPANPPAPLPHFDRPRSTPTPPRETGTDGE